MAKADATTLLAAGYQRVCALRDVPGLLPLPVTVGDNSVLICRQMFGVYAVAETCPHEHVSMAKGTLSRGHLVCPMHRYEFALETGECTNATCAPVATYETQVLGGEVFVRIGPKTTSEALLPVKED